jgi:hypothetical protein
VYGLSCRVNEPLLANCDKKPVSPTPGNCLSKPKREKLRLRWQNPQVKCRSKVISVRYNGIYVEWHISLRHGLVMSVFQYQTQEKLAPLLVSCLPGFLCPGPKMSEHMVSSGHCEMQQQRLGGLGHVPNNTSTIQACGLVPTCAWLPDLRGPHLTVLMWCRTLLLRPGMVLLGPGSMIRLLSLGGRWWPWLARCTRQSAVVGTASKASVLEVWVVSARMGSCGGGVCERTCCRHDNTGVEDCRLVKVRKSWFFMSRRDPELR